MADVVVPDPKSTLLHSLLQALGMLDDQGEVNLGWFSGPALQSVPTTLARRQKLVDALARLFGEADPRTWPQKNERWFSLFGQGFPLQAVLAEEGVGALGLGLRLPLAAPKPPEDIHTPPKVEVRSWLLGVDNAFKAGTDLNDFATLRLGLKLSDKGVLRHLAGEVSFSPQGKASVDLKGQLTAAADDGVGHLKTHTLALGPADWATPRRLVVEALKLGVFLAERGIRREAFAGAQWAARLRDHLFPILEGEKKADGAELIKAFPWVACLGEGADVSGLVLDWLKQFIPKAGAAPQGSFVPTLNLDAAGAVLQHLRGLMTGQPGPVRAGSRTLELAANAEGARLSLELHAQGTGWRVALRLHPTAGEDLVVPLFVVEDDTLKPPPAPVLPAALSTLTLVGDALVVAATVVDSVLQVRVNGALRLSASVAQVTLALPLPGWGVEPTVQVAATPAAVTVGLALGGTTVPLYPLQVPVLADLLASLALPALHAAAKDVMAERFEGTSVTVGQALGWLGLTDANGALRAAADLQTVSWPRALGGLAEGLLKLKNPTMTVGPATLALNNGAVQISASGPVLDVPPLKVTLGPVGLSVSGLAEGTPTVAFSLSNLEVALQAAAGERLIDVAGLSLGGLVANLGLSLGQTTTITRLGLELVDLRLPFSGGSGLAAGLLSSKASDNPGLKLGLGLLRDSQGALGLDKLTGLPVRLVVDKHIGPLDVRAVAVKALPGQKIKVELEAAFQLGPLEVTPFGLGIEIPVRTALVPSTWSLGLDGLGVGFESGGIQLSGLLRRVVDDAGEEFRGALVARAFGFQLGALGAYRMLDGVPSFFVFATLNVPLGGPPFFFVTGLAGGFGLNRSLRIPATVDEIGQMPFLRLMSGQSSMAEAETAIGTWLQPKEGAVWLAAGVKFTSFSLIQGEALLYIVFSPWFEVGLMALARLDLGKLAHIELGLLGRFSTQNDDPTLLVMAGLTGKSWLFSEGTCRLFGGFAFQTWPRRGETVLTVGGYHPAYPVPAHFPVVPRIGFRMDLAGVVAKGECYFAIVPSAAMGGALLEVSGEWGPVAAGFRARFDAIIGWDPFWFQFGLEVLVWVRIGITLELGVSLEIWGEPVGGTGRIKCLFITCDVAFGAPRGGHVALSLATFAETHLHVKPVSLQPLRVHALGRPEVGGAAGTPTEPAVPGLLDIEVPHGGLGAPDAGGPTASGSPPTQDGSAARPFRVAPEFKVRLRSRLPVSQVAWRADDATLAVDLREVVQVGTTLKPRLWQPVSLTPCEKFNLSAPLQVVHGGPPGRPTSAPPARLVRVERTPLPAALFSARTVEQGAAWADGPTTLALFDGVTLHAEAELVPGALGTTAYFLAAELSTPDEHFALPLRSAYAPALHAASATLMAASLVGGSPQRVGGAALDGVRPGLGQRWATLRPTAPVLRSPWAGIAPPFWDDVVPMEDGAIRRTRSLSPPRVDAVVRWAPQVATRIPRVDAWVQLATLPRTVTSVSNRRGPTVPLPVAQVRSAALAQVVLHRFDPTPRSFAHGARAGSRSESMLRRARLKGSNGLRIDGGTAVVVHDLHCPQARRLAGSGDQHATVVAVGPAGTPMGFFGLAPGSAEVTLPMGVERLVVVGQGQDPVGPSVLESHTVVLRVGGRSFATANALVRIEAGLTPPLSGPAAAWEAVLPEAGTLLIHLRAPVGQPIEIKDEREFVEARIEERTEAPPEPPFLHYTRRLLREAPAEVVQGLFEALRPLVEDTPIDRLVALTDRWLRMQIKAEVLTPDRGRQVREGLRLVLLEGADFLDATHGLLSRAVEAGRVTPENAEALLQMVRGAMEERVPAIEVAIRLDERLARLEGASQEGEHFLEAARRLLGEAIDARRMDPDEAAELFRDLRAAVEAGAPVDVLARRLEERLAGLRDPTPTPAGPGTCLVLRLAGGDTPLMESVRWEGVEGPPLLVVEPEGPCLVFALRTPGDCALRLHYQAGFQPRAVALLAEPAEGVVHRLVAGLPGWTLPRPALGGRTLLAFVEDNQDVGATQ